MPIQIGLDLDPGRVCPQPNRLDNRTGPKPPFDPHRHPVRPGFHHLRPTNRQHFLPVRRIILLDIPGVKVPRFIDIGPNLVPPTGQTLPPQTLVKQARQMMANKNYDEAKKCIAQARTKKSSLGWWEPVNREEAIQLLEIARRDAIGDVRRAARAALARLGERSALQWFRQLAGV